MSAYTRTPGPAPGAMTPWVSDIRAAPIAFADRRGATETFYPFEVAAASRLSGFR